jgi:hypothetical protein
MNERVNRLVAVSVAVVSLFLGIAKIKDDNIGQAMADAKARMVDSWNEYQAKKVKHHLDDGEIFQLGLMLPSLSGSALATAEARRQALQEDVARYAEEETKLKAQAEGYDKQYEALNFVDDQFDMSDVACSVSLGMLAVAALVGSMPLLGFAWVFIALGIVEGLSAFAGWGLHPDWIVKLLT